MLVGDPCPMHKHFHTILGLMDAQDPLLSCVYHATTIIISQVPQPDITQDCPIVFKERNYVL